MTDLASGRFTLWTNSAAPPGSAVLRDGYFPDLQSFPKVVEDVCEQRDGSAIVVATVSLHYSTCLTLSVGQNTIRTLLDLDARVAFDLYNVDDDTLLQETVREEPSLMRGIGWAEIISAPNINHNNGAFVRSKVADGFASLVLLEELLAEQRATEYPTRPADAPAWARAFSVGGYGRPPFVLPVSLLRELVARQAELILTVVS